MQEGAAEGLAGLGRHPWETAFNLLSEGRGAFIPGQGSRLWGDRGGRGACSGSRRTRRLCVRRVPIPAGPVGASGEQAGPPRSGSPLSGRRWGGAQGAGAPWGAGPEPTLVVQGPQSPGVQSRPGGGGDYPELPRPGAGTEEWEATVTSSCRQHSGPAVSELASDAIRECSRRTILAAVRPGS